MTQTTQAPVAAEKQTSLITQGPNRDIIDATLDRINQMSLAGEIKLPANYSAPNAIRAAMLIIQDVVDTNKRPALEVCTQKSISFALLKMVIQGLNPIKRQCSFIVYGNKLLCQREYQGSIAIAKRVGLKSVTANAVFEGDEFVFEVDPATGRKKIIKHIPNFESYGGKVKGAYAFVELMDGSTNVEVMSMGQIIKAWEQGPTKGKSPAHINFPDQMACKTVINRAVKTIINSSDDVDLFEGDDDEVRESPVTADVKYEIANNANRREIGFEDESPVQTPEVVDTKKEESTEQPEVITAKPGEQIKAPFA